MVIKSVLSGNTIIINYQLSEKELSVLNFIKETGKIEFPRIFEEKNKIDRTKQFYENDCQNLIKNGFLIKKHVYELTYVLSDLTKEMLENWEYPFGRLP